MACSNSKNAPAKRPNRSTSPRRSRAIDDGARSESGIALIAVLWVMVVLAALAASFSTSTRTRVNLARNIGEAAAAEAIADAAVSRAAAGLALPISEGGIRTDQTIYQWPFAGGLARFVISDEGGKIDLNLASRTLLRDYFDVVGIGGGEAEALADAIVRYRFGSAGDALSDESDGENGEGFAGDGGSAPFIVLEELQRLPGMTGDIYRRIAPALTIYSDQPDPDADAALPAVREARARAQGRRADEERTSTVEEPWPPPPPGPLSILREGSFAPRSMAGVFTIHSEGRSAGGAIFVREAVVAIEYGGDRPYVVRIWRLGRRFLFPRTGDEAL